MPAKPETQIWRRIDEEGLADVLAGGRECWPTFHAVTAYKLRLAREPHASLNELLAECGNGLGPVNIFVSGLGVWG